MFEQIKIDVAALLESAMPPEEDSLQTRVHQAWRTHVLTALSGIIEAHGSDDEATQRACCDFLKNEREFVKLYTAYPNSEITLLLIALAEESANFLMLKHAKEMAGEDDSQLLSHLQAMSDEEKQLLRLPQKGAAAGSQVMAHGGSAQYRQQLIGLAKAISSKNRAQLIGFASRMSDKDKAQLLEQVKAMPEEGNAELIALATAISSKNNQQIMQLSAKLSDKDATRLTMLAEELSKQDDAQFIADVKANFDAYKPQLLKILKSNFHKENNALRLLMPDVVQAGDDKHPDLDKIELRQLVNTHVLSSNNAYLYPVHLLLDIELTEEKSRLPDNPYYDYRAGPDNAQLTASEYEQIKTHSKRTEALVNAKAQYDSLTQDESSLLGQLNRLTQHLSLNSVGGRGEEENAATGAYPAIIHFMEYYERLPEEEKNKIPAQLKSEIDKLFNLSSNPEANINATENIETCIASRRRDLSGAMQGQDVLLTHLTHGTR